MNGDFPHFVMALVAAGVAAAAIYALSWAICWLERAILQRQAVSRRLSAEPTVQVTVLGGRRRAAGQLLGQGAAWMLALFAGVVLGLIFWRARH